MTASSQHGISSEGAGTSLLPPQYVAVSPAPRRRASSPKGREGGLHRRWRALLVVPALIVLFFLWSIIGAAAMPGNEKFSAKWADWLRSHHASIIASTAERWYYTHDAPKKGGQPKQLNKLPASSASVASRVKQHRVSYLPAPSTVPLVVSPALAGEGQWVAVGRRVHGVPGMYESQFRADTIYTSELTSAVWIDPRLEKITLVPGQLDPGGTWSEQPYVTQAERPNIEAAFNGGFQFRDAHGGFYLNGRTAVPLRAGAASLVIYRSGRVDIGAWDSEVRMTPDVVAVLQNLVPMVDHGQVSSVATYNDSTIWGSTLGAATVVARSGVGVTRSGALVYVAGPALTARTLAESLQRAGAARAMTLDINPYWVTFNFFSHPEAAQPSTVVGTSLYPAMSAQRSPDRYLGSTKEARDFLTISIP